MMRVGVREFRDGLSRHLAAVRAGHTVTVTDHGVPLIRGLRIEGEAEFGQQPEQFAQLSAWMPA